MNTSPKSGPFLCTLVHLYFFLWAHLGQLHSPYLDCHLGATLLQCTCRTGSISSTAPRLIKLVVDHSTFSCLYLLLPHLHFTLALCPCGYQQTPDEGHELLPHLHLHTPHTSLEKGGQRKHYQQFLSCLFLYPDGPGCLLACLLLEGSAENLMQP